MFDLSFVFAQGDPVVRAPETLEGAKEGILDIGDKIMQGIPHAIGTAWEEQVLPIWRAMWKWIKEDAWEKRLYPALQTIQEKAKGVAGPEVEKRKEIVQERLKEQKEDYGQEIADHTQEAKQSLWQRFLSLFQKED